MEKVRGVQEPAGRGAWGIDKVERHLGGQFWNADVLVNDALCLEKFHILHAHPSRTILCEHLTPLASLLYLGSPIFKTWLLKINQPYAATAWRFKPESRISVIVQDVFSRST